MKIKLTILGLVLFITSVVVGIVKAEDLKCKTMSNGVCTEYFQPETKCKTMVDGRCTEFYSQVEYNTGYQEPPKTDMRYLNKKTQDNVCSDRFGFSYVLDPYANVWSTWEVYNQSKIFITQVDTNTPAARAGLKVGDEITKINGVRAVKFKWDDFDNYLTGQRTIELELKTASGDKKSMTINKANVCKVTTREPFFDSYWNQIYSGDLEEYNEWFRAIGNVGNKLTTQFKSEYAKAQSDINTWISRKSQFRNGFNMCLANYHTTTDVNNCLNQLVNRFAGTISQENNIKAQQQITNQQINAMNNYSDALRNQHVQVDANVYHSGNVNVNHNIDANVNVNGNYYHHW